MSHDFQELFDHLVRIEPRADLSRAVILRIKKWERISLLVRSFGFSILSIASLVSGVFALLSLSTQLTQSGFNDYLSILVSDYNSLSSSAGSLALSLVESLPLLGIAALLAAVGLFMWSTAKALVETQRVFLLNKI